MFTQKISQRPSLLSYWTSRYFLTLCVGIIVVGVISAWWIRHTTIENRLNMIIYIVEDVANRVVNNNDTNPDDAKGQIPNAVDHARGNVPFLEEPPPIFIVDNYGTILSSNRGREQMLFREIPLIVLEGEQQVQKISFQNQQRFYLIKVPIMLADLRLGWVLSIQPEQQITEVNQEYRQLIIMLAGVAIFGWGAIYVLLRRLTLPIKNVARSLKQVQEGIYEVDLPENVKEAEIHELISSLKSMANRLQQLEALRTELLAGVTHELKTPVASISGLLQALKDGVVSGAEAKEFLEISLKETERLQKMVADLLAFNSFASGAVLVKLETYLINELTKELVHQWEIVQEEQTLELELCLLAEDRTIELDPIRYQQILENLLNNAKQSIGKKHGKMKITLLDKRIQKQVEINIEDNGIGIPEAEKSFIFERFYRGDNKKLEVRGLGLGLPLSKMIAKTLNGDLYLKESSIKGTTFTIVLPTTEEL